jgi:predicted signal transduction protein with EAL and GGDEF domain
MSIGGSHVSCSASAGVATTIDPNARDRLLRHADLALYAAKEAGHGHWRHYEPAMTNAVMHRPDMHSSPERAVDNDELTLEYQPIVALASGLTVGFEALLRWDHPTRGRLMPGEFIDAAEDAGHIIRIGRWVLLGAMAAAVRWTDVSRESIPYVAVNVSPSQFRSTGFVDDVYRMCEASNRHPPTDAGNHQPTSA